MKIITGLLGLALLFSAHVSATCELDPSKSGPAPHYFNMPNTTISVEADAPSSTTQPIYRYDIEPQSYTIYLSQCVDKEPYGKTAINLPAPGASAIYPTNIPGVGIKIIYNNGSDFGTGIYPVVYYTNFSPSPIGAYVYVPASFFRVEVYKIADSLSLTPLGDNILLPPNNYVYNWNTIDALDHASQIVHLDTIKIVSTPSCNFDNHKTVDFGTLTGNMLDASETIEKPLDFSITCQTDYGTYSATASISSDSTSSDGSYIKVTDAAGTSDKLAIRLKDDKGADLLVDGSSAVTINNLASKMPAEFHWKATVMAQPGATQHPAEGNFNAHAEILLQVK
ncbi:fimbrial protein [Lelliottia amnigena]|uniref:Fimbrial protein n=1 Tax=Lelliottia amnigena TaxID=61646 RepID=A0AAP2ACI3_LELAM|nr:fimbrial protein [Lelliottia amnigena]MBL5898132.1 fimbrial protein [Lelliottia amnigena]MBL5934061.1 fimbrial protein [Lelliottia amnigena]